MPTKRMPKMRMIYSPGKLPWNGSKPLEYFTIVCSNEYTGSGTEQPFGFESLEDAQKYAGAWKEFNPAMKYLILKHTVYYRLPGKGEFSITLTVFKEPGALPDETKCMERIGMK